MPLVLDATVGGPKANTYCTVEEADTYHEAHPYSSTWANATEDQKKRALVTATRLLDEHIEWNGWVATSTQALLWPRVGTFYKSGYVIDSTVLPKELKHATAELARQLLDANRMADSDIETQGITQITAGSIGLEFDSAKVQVKVIPDAVFSLIRHLGYIKSRRAASVQLVRK
jgi:hypothetical protein